MDEELIRHYRRWIEAEDGDRSEEADAAFRAVFSTTAAQPAASRDFAARTMEAVAAAAAGDARRARRLRRMLLPVAAAGVAALAYFGAGLAGSAFSVLIVGSLDLLVGLVVSVATTLAAGADVWTVMSSLGRAAATLLTNPAVTATILAIQGIALAALLALRHLLGSDGESFR